MGWTPGVGYKLSTSRKEPEVSQNNSDQGQAAETPTEETKTFIRQVRSATRRKHAPEDKIRIVLDGFRREVTVSDLCRRDRLPANGVGEFQLHHLVGEQSQGPGGVPRGGRTTGHGHQVGFLLPIKFAPFSRPWPVIEGTFEPSFHETLPHPADRGGTYHNSFSNLLVGSPFIGLTHG